MLATFPTEWARFAPQPRPLQPGQKWNVFLSYRSVNRRWVLQLYDVLKELGHTVFLDQYVLAAGQDLVLRLQDELAASQAGVLIWTHDSDSNWVKREYQTMLNIRDRNADFNFVPLRLDTSELPLFAANQIYLDFSSYPDGPNGGELLRLLHAIVGQPLSDDAVKFAAEQDQLAREAAARVDAAILNENPNRLIQLFEQGGLPWETTAALGCKAAEGLTRLKRDADAIAMLAKVEQRFPRAIRPRQLRALALARSGDFMAGQEILAELYAAGEHDPETVGIWARTWADRYYAEQPRRIDYLKRSRDLYIEAFTLSPDDSYVGINAAAKSVLVGEPRDLERAAELAERVKNLVGAEPKVGDDYWKVATRAELELIQRNYQAAARLYESAIALARFETGSHGSTWLQACRLMARLQPTAGERALIRAVFQHLPDCGELPVE